MKLVRVSLPRSTSGGRLKALNSKSLGPQEASAQTGAWGQEPRRS